MAEKGDNQPSDAAARLSERLGHARRRWRWFPCVVAASSVVSGFGRVRCRLPDGRLVPARPLGRRRRWRAAWLVLTGRAGALVWDGGQ